MKGKGFLFSTLLVNTPSVLYSWWFPTEEACEQQCMYRKVKVLAPLVQHREQRQVPSLYKLSRFQEAAFNYYNTLADTLFALFLDAIVTLSAGILNTYFNTRLVFTCLLYF